MVRVLLNLPGNPQADAADALAAALCHGNSRFVSQTLAESLKTAYPSSRIDHINASVTAFTVNQSTKNLQSRVAQHSPDVLFIYHAVNDVGVNGAELASQLGQTRATKPKNPAFQWLIKTSLLVELVHKNLLIVSQQRKSNDARQKVAFDRDYMTERFRNDLKRLVDEGLSAARLVVIPTFSNRLRRSQSEEERLDAAVVGSALDAGRVRRGR